LIDWSYLSEIPKDVFLNWKSIFMLIGLAPSFESTVDLLTTMETSISFPDLVEMLKYKEQPIKPTKIQAIPRYSSSSLSHFQDLQQNKHSKMLK